ncbi:MAG: rod shape-determining protein MreD [Patescibacteria group bacterium]
MAKNIIALFVSFYIFALLQTSFLVSFNISGIIPDAIIISVILINLFEDSGEKFGFLAAFIGGFFLDLFSSDFIGLHILILIAVSFFVKFILRRYVRIPTFQRI